LLFGEAVPLFCDAALLRQENPVQESSAQIKKESFLVFENLNLRNIDRILCKIIGEPVQLALVVLKKWLGVYKI